MARALNHFKESRVRLSDDAVVPPLTPSPLDLRGLEPPEPLLRVLAALAGTTTGPHRFLFDRPPVLLYPILRHDGWRHEIRSDERGFELTVFRNVANP